MKERQLKKPRLDRLRGDYVLSENTVVRLCLEPFFKHIPAKDWKNLEQLVNFYLKYSVTYFPTGKAFHRSLCEQFHSISLNKYKPLVQVVKYAKTVEGFLETATVRVEIQIIYEEKELAMHLEKAELRLANKNEITTRELLAKNSKMITSRSRSGAPCADISSNRVAGTFIYLYYSKLNN